MAATENAPGGAAEAPATKVERAHQMYREGRHQEALAIYSDALAGARTRAQRIALHSNRAACFLKLHHFNKAAEECTSVLELDRQHTGALMLRAQTYVTLKDYQSALFDVNRLMEINPLSEVYRNLHARLKTQLSLAPIPESEEELLHEDERDNDTASSKGSKQIVSSPIKAVARATQAPKSDTAADLLLELKGWEAIPKPKGHTGLDYSRWDKVADDSSGDEDDEDEDEDPQPRIKFRVKTVGIQPVK